MINLENEIEQIEDLKKVFTEILEPGAPGQAQLPQIGPGSRHKSGSRQKNGASPRRFIARESAIYSLFNYQLLELFVPVVVNRLHVVIVVQQVQNPVQLL